MGYKDDQALTAGILVEILNEFMDKKIKPRFAAIEQKMMDGFDALNRKIDTVDANLSGRIDKLEDKVSDIDERVNLLERNGERRYKVLSNQISLLALTKVDNIDTV